MKNALEALLDNRIENTNDLMLKKRIIAQRYGIRVPTNASVLKEYNKQIKKKLRERDPELEKVLRKRAIRTLSGIAPVAVLTMPYPCPGKCAYCPTEKNVPQSYLSNEPAVMRAIRCNYHPYTQVSDRLRALINNGHEPTKIELIVIGGTWSYLPEKYKYWYIKECFRAANDFRITYKKSSSDVLKFNDSKSFKNLKKEIIIEQKKNEKTKYKIIGITLETRPDYINEKEIIEMRELGCTRVELGVQAVDDKILELNKRGSNVSAIVNATKLLKNSGFKVTYHIMPGLPGSSPKKDVLMYKKLFTDARFQPDQIKFYPTVVTKGSLLYKWWQSGKYKPYKDNDLLNIIIKCKESTPEYVRIIRLIRDIPAESIIAGNITTNLRQVIQDNGVSCRCIRCREARSANLKTPKLKIIKYEASGGEEYFISYVSKDDKILYGFCRLRLPNQNFLPFMKEDVRRGSKTLKEPTPPLPFIKGGGLCDSALIRELHVYGELTPVGKNGKVQHSGLGKKLLTEAENIATKHKYKKIAVISGIGVREYYKKLEYRLKDTYMIKVIK